VILQFLTKEKLLKRGLKVSVKCSHSLQGYQNFI